MTFVHSVNTDPSQTIGLCLPVRNQQTIMPKPRRLSSESELPCQAPVLYGTKHVLLFRLFLLILFDYYIYIF